MNTETALEPPRFPDLATMAGPGGWSVLLRYDGEVRD